mgnify:CR=1 FL=1
MHAPCPPSSGRGSGLSRKTVPTIWLIRLSEPGQAHQCQNFDWAGEISDLGAPRRIAQPGRCTPRAFFRRGEGAPRARRARAATALACRFGGTGRLLIPIHTTQWLAKHDSGLLCLRNIKVLCVSHQVLGWLQGGGYRLQPPRHMDMDVVRRRGHSTCAHEGGT